MTVFGDEDHEANSEASKWRAYLHPRELLHPRCIMTGRDTCQGPVERDIKNVLFCLTTCFEPRNGQARGLFCSRSSFDDGRQGFYIHYNPGCRPNIAPLFSIILTDPASTRAVRLSHRLLFPTISTVTAETMCGAFHRPEARNRRRKLCLTDRTQKVASTAGCFVIA